MTTASQKCGASFYHSAASGVLFAQKWGRNRGWNPSQWMIYAPVSFIWTVPAMATVAAEWFIQRFRGGLVFKAHKLLYHSTLGLTVTKKKKKACVIAPGSAQPLSSEHGAYTPVEARFWPCIAVKSLSTLLNYSLLALWVRCGSRDSLFGKGVRIQVVAAPLTHQIESETERISSLQTCSWAGLHCPSNLHPCFGVVSGC